MNDKEKLFFEGNKFLNKIVYSEGITLEMYIKKILFYILTQMEIKMLQEK